MGSQILGTVALLCFMIVCNFPMYKSEDDQFYECWNKLTCESGDQAIKDLEKCAAEQMDNMDRIHLGWTIKKRAGVKLWDPMTEAFKNICEKEGDSIGAYKKYEEEREKKNYSEEVNEEYEKFKSECIRKQCE